MPNISLGLTRYAVAIIALLAIAATAYADFTSLKKASITDARLANLFPQSCHLSGHFVEQKNLIGLSEPLLSQGQFMFACDRGLTWHTDKPINEALIYSLGRQHFQYSQETQAIAPLTGRLHNNIGKLLVGIMGADIGYIDQYFQLIDEPRTDDAKAGKPYRFVPRKKAMKKFISELRLQKNDAGGDANIIVEFDQPNVGSTVLTITQVQYREGWSRLSCLEVFNNNTRICERFSSLNKPGVLYTDDDPVFAN